MVQRALIAAAIAFAIVAASAAPAGASSARISGVAVHPWRFEESERLPFWPLRDPAVRDRSFAALRDSGIRSARVDLRWSMVEHYAKGLRDWSEFDAIHASAVRYGIELVPMVAFAPRWANGGAHDVWVPPVNPADFGDFLGAALERYPDIKTWEVWNEANLAFFWRPKPDVAAFVALLRAADEARDRVGSQAQLISGGLSSNGEDPFRWFDEMARLGAFAHIDGFGIHPYGRRGPDHPKSSFLRLPELRRKLVKLGREEIHLWLTEYGIPHTSIQTNFGPPATAEQQAENLGRAFTLASMWPWVENLSWYELQEGCTDREDPDCGFGLFNPDFGPKPALARLQATMGGAITRVRTTLTLGLKAGSASGGARRVRVLGRLDKAGEQSPAGTVRVTATSGSRVRSVGARARRGAYAADLGRLGAGTWRVVARFAGAKRHLPAESRAATVKVPR